MIVIILTAILFAPFRENTDYEKAAVYIWRHTSQFTDTYRLRLVTVILKYSLKYSLPPILFARQIYIESLFKRRAFSTAKCRGLTQISHRHWSHVLHHIDDGKLGRHIKQRGIKNTKKYWYRIGYSVEAGAWIMRKLLNKYRHYPICLLRYAYTTKTFKKFRDKPYQKKYVKFIMGNKPRSQ